MKINVSVANEYLDRGYYYTFNSGKYEVCPFKITRREAGRYRKTAMKYHYQAHFIGLDGMLDCHNKSLLGVSTVENIVRGQNPKFNPKKLTWDKNTATITTSA